MQKKIAKIMLEFSGERKNNEKMEQQKLQILYKNREFAKLRKNE